MISTNVRGTRASDHLDMIRGLAAVMVLLFHVRYRFFLDYADVNQPGWLAKAWYVLTAFGHDAVMVFFVVSGLLVGATTLRSCRRGTWAWKDYVMARAVRIYVVLLPALALTWVWDSMGLAWFGEHAIYTGSATWFRHDYFDVSARSGIGNFAGNALSLQGILVPTFGSNDALWSLAFECWYYVAFPLVVLAVVPGSWIRRACCALAASACFWFLPGIVSAYFVIWLLGVGVGSMPSYRAVMLRQRAYAGIALVLFGGTLLATHAGIFRAFLGDSLWATDFIIGATFAAALFVLLHDRRPASTGAYGQVARALANISYTLYLVHLPLLVFLRGSLTGEPWAPEVMTIVLGLAVAVVAMGYSFALASLTEAHTAAVKRWLAMSRGSAAPAMVTQVPVMGVAAARGDVRTDLLSSSGSSE